MMAKKSRLMENREWTNTGVFVGAAAGAVGLMAACGQYCEGLHEVLGVMTTGALLGALPGAIGGRICAVVDELVNGA